MIRYRNTFRDQPLELPFPYWATPTAGKVSHDQRQSVRSAPKGEHAGNDCVELVGVNQIKMPSKGKRDQWNRIDLRSMNRGQYEMPQPRNRACPWTRSKGHERDIALPAQSLSQVIDIALAAAKKAETVTRIDG
jgi:hypothetical protein